MLSILRLLALAAVLTLAAPAPGAFAEAAKAKEDEGSARAMDVQNVMAPIVRDGRLVNYVFISARIQLASNIDPWRTREKGHFLRDALIRAVHRQSLAVADRNDQVDRAAAQALFTTIARQTLGASAVQSVEITDTSSLRPGAGRRA